MSLVTISEAAELLPITKAALRRAQYRYTNFPAPAHEKSVGRPTLYDRTALENWVQWRRLTHCSERRQFVVRAG